MDEKEKQWRLFFKKVYLKYGTDYRAWGYDGNDDHMEIPDGWFVWIRKTEYVYNDQFTEKFISEVILGENNEQK